MWRIALVLSLALNLAVVGIVVGSYASGRVGDGPPRSFDLGLGPVSRALLPEERREIGRNLRQNRVMRDVDLRDRVDGMSAVLRAEPFDPEALRVLMDDQAAQISNVQAKAQDAFLAQIAAMTPERRRMFADQLLQEMSKDRRRRSDNSGG
jgi:hypothetical protein